MASANEPGALRRPSEGPMQSGGIARERNNQRTKIKILVL